MTQTVKFPRRLFAPDFVLPSQFVGTLRRQAPRKTGEYRLLIAVLENAVECFQKYVQAKSSGERRLFEEAEQWIMSEDDEDARRSDGKESAKSALSFEYVCEVLGIEPDYLRHGLRRWRNTPRVTAHERPSVSGGGGGRKGHKGERYLGRATGGHCAQPGGPAEEPDRRHHGVAPGVWSGAPRPETAGGDRNQ